MAYHHILFFEEKKRGNLLHILILVLLKVETLQCVVNHGGRRRRQLISGGRYGHGPRQGRPTAQHVSGDRTGPIPCGPSHSGPSRSRLNKLWADMFVGDHVWAQLILGFQFFTAAALLAVPEHRRHEPLLLQLRPAQPLQVTSAAFIGYLWLLGTSLKFSTLFSFPKKKNSNL